MPNRTNNQNQYYPQIAGGDLICEYGFVGVNLTYIMLAAPGTATSSPGWQIKRLEYDETGNIIKVRFAGGTNTFSNIADNAAILSYS